MNRRKNNERNFGKSIETPRKRQRTSLSSRTPKDDFMKAYDEDNPIVVMVTPLRKLQGEILMRNLQKAGAHVINSVDELLPTTSVDETSITAKRLIIVTDNRQKALSKIPEDIRSNDRIKYVSTKWASAVLSARKCLDFKTFTLFGNESSPRRTALNNQLIIGNDSAPATQITNHTTVPFLPVWCKVSVTETSDIDVKRVFLKSIPVLQCERATYATTVYPSPNAYLCNLLQDIARKNELETIQSVHEADIRARAYRRASASLKCVPFKLRNADDVTTLISFGPRVISLVREFVCTGEINEVKQFQEENRLKMLDKFSKLYGVGVKTAIQFYDDVGIRSMGTLHRKVNDSPQAFSTSLIEYMKWESKVSRVSFSIACEFRDACLRVLKEEANVQLRAIICGGLRRGEVDGHDIDIIYCRSGPEKTSTASVMSVLRIRLEEAGLIVSILRESSDVNGWGDTRYGQGNNNHNKGNFRFAHDIMHAIGKWKGIFFRVDFVGVRDRDEIAFTTLAWSGSTMFQRDLRMLAEKRGWTFNDHGLFDRQSGERVKMLPKVESEMDVFAALGLTYRPPFERCG